MSTVNGNINPNQTSLFFKTNPTRREPQKPTDLFRDNFYNPQTNSAGENERYFSKLEENDYAAKGKFDYNLKEEEDDISVLEFGGDYRYTERLFSATIFNVSSYSLINLKLTFCENNWDDKHKRKNIKK